MAHYAQRYDVDDVFCGRIHSAAIREFGNACKIRQKCYQAFDLPMSVNAVPAPASDNAVPMIMTTLKPETKDSSTARRISCRMAGSGSSGSARSASFVRSTCSDRDTVAGTVP